jgi:hypothetical protein
MDKVIADWLSLRRLALGLVARLSGGSGHCGGFAKVRHHKPLPRLFEMHNQATCTAFRNNATRGRLFLCAMRV